MENVFLDYSFRTYTSRTLPLKRNNGFDIAIHIFVHRTIAIRKSHRVVFKFRLKQKLQITSHFTITRLILRFTRNVSTKISIKIYTIFRLVAAALFSFLVMVSVNSRFPSLIVHSVRFVF